MKMGTEICTVASGLSASGDMGYLSRVGIERRQRKRDRGKKKKRKENEKGEVRSRERKVERKVQGEQVRQLQWPEDSVLGRGGQCSPGSLTPVTRESPPIRTPLSSPCHPAPRSGASLTLWPSSSAFL